ncbi:prolyl aminopeptidase-like protein [Melanomma pulvis-pyrius CBS 109.77]|uniref:Prolyl aminopeptidase-like protein n=1 Tax=Melanomma pulvis-pyrius CBS 109.77 TaxID=1314802 RepID=A0A6A6XR92_9PLEO|nr:prolyl aminopeptidase-like protein [Melanomma pulvis-pyrius CBS 109.77]
MARPLPTIVFFAGAFADPSCFNRLAALFNDAGYPTVYATALSLNPSDPADITTAKDAQHAREKVLLPLVEDENKEVVVFTHSYGGVVGGAAAAGLSKSARKAEGKKGGGVIGLLYLVGNIVCEGETLLQAVGGAYPPFIKENNPSKGLAIIDPVMEILYNDVDISLKAEMEAGMIPNALAAFETPSGPPAWAEPEFNGRRTYLKTINDQCNPLFLQDMWLQKSAVEWETVDIQTSHCPFISRPAEVADICVGIFKRWAE